MDTVSMQTIVVFALTFLSFLVFFALDGFDLGSGMILPFFSREDAERKKILDAIWPFWDGNELWAVIGGALLLAGFPALFVGLVGGLSPFVAMLLVFLMLRAVAFEAWYKDAKRRKLWELLLAAASFLLAFAFGFGFGAVLNGLSIDSNGGYSGVFMDLIQPLPLLSGLLAVSAAVLHATQYLGRKFAADALGKVRALARIALPVTSALGLATLVWIALLTGAFAKPLFLVGSLGAALALCLMFVKINFRKGAAQKPAFLESMLAILGFGVAWAAALFPWLLRPSSRGPGLSLAETANAPGTMRFLAIAGPPAFILAALFSAVVYRSLKGSPEASGHEGERLLNSNEKKGVHVIKALVRCKSCGYIMEAEKVGLACPACGVPAKQFEPFDDKLSEKRRAILEIHIHPVIVHMPQALSALLVVFCLVLFLPLGTLQSKLADTAQVLALLLPFTALAAIASGIYDGKLRFRSLKPILLKRKIVLGLGFLLCSSAGALVAGFRGLEGTGSIALLLVFSSASLGFGAFLGIIGSRLGIAKFPG